jgi:hypothetical protein
MTVCLLYASFVFKGPICYVEFAEYTSAQERIALGKKARKKAATDRRTAMQELIADACVILYFCSGYTLLTKH